MNRGVTFEKGERIVDVRRNESESKPRVKVNINFVSRGGPDRAVRRPAGSTGEFCSSDLGIVLSELIAVDSVSSRYSASVSEIFKIQKFRTPNRPEEDPKEKREISDNTFRVLPSYGCLRIVRTLLAGTTPD